MPALTAQDRIGSDSHGTWRKVSRSPPASQQASRPPVFSPSAAGAARPRSKRRQPFRRRRPRTRHRATTVTVASTTTVERIATQETVPTTTTAESSDDGTPVWVWVLLAILAIALAAAIVLLARRGGHGSLSPEERGRRLDHAVGTWAAQGWAVETQTHGFSGLAAGGRADDRRRRCVRSDHNPSRLVQPGDTGIPTAQQPGVIGQLRDCLPLLLAMYDTATRPGVGSISFALGRRCSHGGRSGVSIFSCRSVLTSQSPLRLGRRIGGLLWFAGRPSSWPLWGCLERGAAQALCRWTVLRAPMTVGCWSSSRSSVSQVCDRCLVTAGWGS